MEEARNLKYIQLVLEDLNPHHRSLSGTVESMKAGHCGDEQIQRIVRMQKDLQEKHDNIFEYLKTILASMKKGNA